MIKKEIGYSYNDLTIVPAVLSDVKSRSEIICKDSNNRLPIFVAPMSSVINEKNYEEFERNGLYTVIPRSVPIMTRIRLFGNDGKLFNDIENRFIAMSLSEFEKHFCDPIKARTSYRNKHFNVCVDIANGHMKHLYDLCFTAKKLAYEHEYTLILMVGNIANPETYREICMMTYDTQTPIIDYVRVGIGNGAGCTTSSNVSIHYPIATLIDECNNIKKELQLPNPTKIVADGGIRNFSDVIKALALGADYVMIGSLFAKALESCGAKQFTNYKGEKQMCSAQEAYELYEKGAQLYTRFYGMASADGQIAISGKKTKTAEGIVKMLPVEYKLYKWVENMDSYLRSAMSYCDCKKLDEFIGKQTLIVNSIGEQSAVNK